MSNGKKAAGPFDVKTVESLIALMTQNDLCEIYLRDGNQHLRLRRGGAAPAVVPATVVPLAPRGRGATMLCRRRHARQSSFRRAEEIGR